MEELDILNITSVIGGFMAITLMLIRFVLVMSKKITFKTNMKFMEAIIAICIAKVVLGVLTFSIFGVVAWTLNTFIWLMISVMEKNNNDNKERIRRGEEPVFMDFKETLSKVGETFKFKK